MSELSSFSTFDLPKPLFDAISRMGFETATPVQAKSIPLVLEGRDVVSLAETGSGKTAAFLIPVIQRHLTGVDKKQVLILAPTRELAVQIVDVAKKLTATTPQISSALLIGGVPMDRQINMLRRRPALLIATPGRLMDHQRRRSVDLRNVGTLILDEADRMFDMGFAPQVREIARLIPVERQTMLFSATFPPEIRELAQKILRDPIDISVQKKIQPPAKIAQKVIEVTQESKNDKTLDLINAASGSVLIFARTKHRTDRLARYLQDYGVKVARLHGDRSQGQRNQALQGFRGGQFRVLVATDIAARGIDIDSVSDVINYDLPMNHEDYIHRIGRTGRAGREGQASTLVTNQDRWQWEKMARRIGLGAGSDAPKGQPQSKPKHHSRPRPSRFHQKKKPSNGPKSFRT